MEEATGRIRLAELTGYLFSSRSMLCCNSVSLRIGTGFPIVNSSHFLQCVQSILVRPASVHWAWRLLRNFPGHPPLRELLGRLPEVLVEELGFRLHHA